MKLARTVANASITHSDLQNLNRYSLLVQQLVSSASVYSNMTVYNTYNQDCKCTFPDVCK